jgi:hypothetical protein
MEKLMMVQIIQINSIFDGVNVFHFTDDDLSTIIEENFEFVSKPMNLDQKYSRVAHFLSDSYVDTSANSKAAISRLKPKNSMAMLDESNLSDTTILDSLNRSQSPRRAPEVSFSHLSCIAHGTLFSSPTPQKTNQVDTAFAEKNTSFRQLVDDNSSVASSKKVLSETWHHQYQASKLLLTRSKTEPARYNTEGLATPSAFPLSHSDKAGAYNTPNNTSVIRRSGLKEETDWCKTDGISEELKNTSLEKYKDLQSPKYIPGRSVSEDARLPQNINRSNNHPPLNNQQVLRKRNQSGGDLNDLRQDVRNCVWHQITSGNQNTVIGWSLSVDDKPSSCHFGQARQLYAPFTVPNVKANKIAACDSRRKQKTANTLKRRSMSVNQKLRFSNSPKLYSPTTSDFIQNHDYSFNETNQNNVTVMDTSDDGFYVDCVVEMNISVCSDNISTDKLNRTVVINSLYGLVVGGNFQNSFHDQDPIVVQPSSNQCRVANCQIDNNKNLKLYIYEPNSKQMTLVVLMTGWICIRANPIGYLVSEYSVFSPKNKIAFYLPHHPFHWSDDCQMDNYDVDTPIQCDSFKSFMMSVFAKVKVDWTNNTIITHVVDFLGLSEHLLTVCKGWSLVWHRKIAYHISIGACAVKTSKSMTKFLTQYYSGNFVSQGACKEVFCLQKDGGQQSAVSLMDLKDLEWRGSYEIVKKELEISLACSWLVTLNICPNLIRIFSVFKSPYRLKRNPDSTVNLDFSRFKYCDRMYQYIEMEYCDGKDLEEFVRSKAQLELETVRKMFFQMCYAVYACREKLAIRHFDIKLLNFFVTTGKSLLTEEQREEHDFNLGLKRSYSSDLEELGKQSGSRLKISEEDNEIDYYNQNISVVYSFGTTVNEFQVGYNDHDIVKLADFGTSCIGHREMGKSITMDQVTILIASF